MKFSEQEIDALLASVEDAMSKADKLAKSMPFKKDGEDEHAAEAPAPDMAPEAAPDASASPAPEMAAPEAPAEAPADGDAPAMGDEQLAQDGQDQGEISDEELHEIYASMQPDELQRHIAIIQACMGQADQGAPAPDAAAPAPEMGAPASPDMAPPQAMKAEAGEAEANATAPAKPESMGKSEEFKKLASENDALKKSLDKVVAAMEKAFKPTRKAVTNLEYVKKSEDSSSDKPLVKSEVLPKLNELTRSTSLTKSDRAAITDYVLNNGSQDKVKNILKGGK